jgi:hypothetical protein
MKTLSINRAPVLTLWAAVVAERLGFEHDEALTLGRAVAGLAAYSKGKSLGLFQPTPEEVRVKRAARARRAGVLRVELLNRAVPVLQTKTGLRAAGKDSKPLDPAGVQRYLESKFGEALGPVSAAMIRLAGSREPEALAAEAYALYERFRPAVAAGVEGWGAPGKLDLGRIAQLAKRR